MSLSTRTYNTPKMLMVDLKRLTCEQSSVFTNVEIHVLVRKLKQVKKSKNYVLDAIGDFCALVQ